MARKNSSELWTYFQKDSATGKAVCITCKEKFSFKSTTANLKSHLRRKHVCEYSAFISNLRLRQNTPPRIVSLISREESESHDNSRNLEVGGQTQTGNETRLMTSFSKPNRKRQGMLDLYRPIPSKISGERKKQIDRDLMDLFIDGFQPFNLVEERSFKKFARWIPGYSLPSKRTLSNSLLTTTYEQTKEFVKNSVHGECESICITTDSWSFRGTESYIAVTGHYIAKDLTFKTFLLGCCNFSCNHTNQHIANELKKIVQDWSLEGKVNFAVTDNASNLTKAVKDTLQWEHFGCYAHTLNVIVEDALKLCSESIGKLKTVVRIFKKSPTLTVKLLKCQIQQGRQPKTLKQDIDTHWNSTYYMLERFVEVEEAVRATIALIDENLPVITDEEWLSFSQLCRVLKPFEEMIASMSDQKYMTGSSVIVITRCLTETCIKLSKEKFCSLVLDVVSELKQGLADRFKELENNIILTVCTFLDPRFKMQAFVSQSAAKRTKDRIQNLVAEEMNENIQNDPTLSPVPESSDKNEFSPWAIFDSLISEKTQVGTALSRANREVQMYLNDEVLPRKSATGKWNCPLEWWKNHQQVYPNLCKIFRKHCNVVATSVPCERLFSKSGLIINDRRTRLTTRKVEQLMFLNVNMDGKRFKYRENSICVANPGKAYYPGELCRLVAFHKTPNGKSKNASRLRRSKKPLASKVPERTTVYSKNSDEGKVLIPDALPDEVTATTDHSKICDEMEAILPDALPNELTDITEIKEEMPDSDSLINVRDHQKPDTRKRNCHFDVNPSIQSSKRTYSRPRKSLSLVEHQGASSINRLNFSPYSPSSSTCNFKTDLEDQIQLNSEEIQDCEDSLNSISLIATISDGGSTNMGLSEDLESILPDPHPKQLKGLSEDLECNLPDPHPKQLKGLSDDLESILPDSHPEELKKPKEEPPDTYEQEDPNLCSILPNVPHFTSWVKKEPE